jgi:hypothetical protein
MLFTITSPFYSESQLYNLYFNDYLLPFYFQDLNQICNYIKTFKNTNEVIFYRDKTDIKINYNDTILDFNRFLNLIP